MTQITIVLPYALPPAELAPDLVRAMNAPALAALLTRATCTSLDFDDRLRALPHEAWMAKTLGLSNDGSPAFAAAAMRGLGLDPGADSWFIINPAHIEIARSNLTISDPRQLHLHDNHARELYDIARPVFDDMGRTLLYGNTSTWFMRSNGWETLQTASPDAAIGMNLTDWLPLGPGASDFRKLQNEVQMLWFEHRINVERESQGLAAVNSFWPWGMSSATAAMPAEPAFATTHVPSWLAAMATSPLATLPNPFARGSADSMLVCGDLSAPAIATDWAGWLAHMERFEKTLFAPALAALKQGDTGQLKLVLGHRNGLKEFATTKWAQRAFWRSPTLDPLLP